MSGTAISSTKRRSSADLSKSGRRSSMSLNNSKSKSSTSLKKKISKTKPKKSKSNEKMSLNVDVSEAALFQRQLPTFYHPDRRKQDIEYNYFLNLIKDSESQTNITCPECNNKNEKLNRLIKLVKTKDKWDKEEYIELLENLILQTDQVFDEQQPDIDKITNKIELLSTE